MVNLMLAAANLEREATADFGLIADVEYLFFTQKRAEHEAGDHGRVEDGVINALGRHVETLDRDGFDVVRHI